jgi:hypothetical protein
MHRLFATTLMFALVSCGDCDVVQVVPIEGEGEGDVGEGEGEGEGDVGEGEGDVGEGEGDAGPVCVFDNDPEFAYTCEGDEDWCDDVGSERVGPLSDIVAVWGRIEGDKVILEARFRMLPARAPGTVVYLFLNEEWGFTPTGTSFFSPPYRGSLQPNDGTLSIGSSFGYTYPLAFGPVDILTGSSGWYFAGASHSYNPCDILISPDKPYYKYVFHRVEGDVYEYAFLASRLIDPPMYDLSNDGFDPYWLTPTGGKPDEDIAYESICTMSCAAAGGREQ